MAFIRILAVKIEDVVHWVRIWANPDMFLVVKLKFCKL